MSEDVLERVAPAGRALAYGGDPNQLIELYTTEGRPDAVVVFLHGGFWRDAYDRVHARPLANALVEHGYAVALVEYRRTGGGGGWPSTFDDVRRAVTVLRHDTDPRVPLILAGHSAGGHLALWAASTSTRFAGVVALAPVTDLVACETDGVGGDAVTLLLGGTPTEQSTRYASVDPMALDALPNVSIVHGVDDSEVPVDMSRRYAKEKGADLVEMSDTGHYELIDPLSRQWTTVLDAIARTVTKHRAAIGEGV